MTQLRPARAQWALDAARYGFRALFEQALPPDEPEVLRLLAGLGWHAEAMLSPVRNEWLVEELQASFGLNRAAADAGAREAWDLWMQGRLEDAVIARLASTAGWVRLEGALPESGLVLHLSAGSRKMAAWALAEAGAKAGRPRGWVGVHGRRGLPPSGEGARRASWLNRWDAADRLRADDMLPVRWIEEEDSLRRHLDSGGLAVVAVDDRGFTDNVAGTLFGRPTALATLPWTLASEFPTVLLSVERLRDKTHLARLLSAPGGPEAMLAALEADVRRRPGHFAMTLVDWRMRGG